MKSSAVEGIGSLIASYEGGMLAEYVSWMHSLVSAFVCGNARVQWSACESLEVALPQVAQNADTTLCESATQQLSLFIRTSANAKSCTHAARALQSLHTRSHYGQSFASVVLACFEMFDATDEREKCSTESGRRQESQFRSELFALAVHLILLAGDDDRHGMSIAFKRHSKALASALNDAAFAFGVEGLKDEQHRSHNLDPLGLHALRRLGCESSHDLRVSTEQLHCAVEVARNWT